MEQVKASIQKWLKFNFSNQNFVQELYIIGSFTYKEFSYINDVDIVQVLSYNTKFEITQFIGELKTLKISFKDTFGKNLHVTSFNQNEKSDFDQFITLNQYTKII